MTFADASAHAGRYIHWGVVNISVTNLTIIAAMIVVFALAIAIPFHGTGGDDEGSGR
jgi:hypothetical protein